MGEVNSQRARALARLDAADKSRSELLIARAIEGRRDRVFRNLRHGIRKRVDRARHKGARIGICTPAGP
jgi:hypothetical protein